MTGGFADFNNLLSVIHGAFSGPTRLDEVGERFPPHRHAYGPERVASLTNACWPRAQAELKTNGDLATLSALAELLERTPRPGVEIETRFRSPPPCAYTGTRTVPKELFMIAIRNATGVHYDPRKREKVGEQSQLKPGEYVRLIMTDEGEGMNEATLSRAIEPFFTTKGIGKGTGLGLPMVHGLAEQSGGKFALRSKPDKGTTAELWLPVSSEAPARKLVPFESLGESTGVSDLAVDDEHSCREHRHHAARAGHAVRRQFRSEAVAYGAREKPRSSGVPIMRSGMMVRPWPMSYRLISGAPV